jgi:hypothetical protein
MWETAVVLGGLAHLGMVGVGLRVPGIFGWKEDLARLRPANRRLFWVYGAFIVLANVGFAVLSLAYPREIAAGRGLAGGFALFVGLYWAARLAVQIFAFDTEDWPAEARRPWARHGLTLAIAAMVAAYGGCFARGLLP